jgi:hypothetical protein
MIDDLSRTLQAIFDDAGVAASFPELSNALISFDRPSETFKPSQTTLDLFLYDVRENMELRSSEPDYERRDGEVLIRRPPMRVACSYLLTAWPVGGPELSLQEHRLLSQALYVLSGHPTIPAKFLKNSLAGQEPPLPLVTTHADGLKNPSEFWTAVGNKLRPSVTIVATIALDIFAPETAPMVVTSDVRLGERATSGGLTAQTTQDLFHIGGQVKGANKLPVAGAAVELKNTGLRSVTDAEGRYQFGPLAKGSYTVRVQAGQSVKEVNIVVPAVSGSNYNVQF